MKIPKTIHYCWFGQARKSELMLKCISSWKKYMPDYEIIEWNENNYSLGSTYEKEAYNEKAYAFVSDLARLKIIYEHGGIYLDTDVELIKSLTPILSNGGYLAQERKNSINTGLGFAATAKDNIILALIKDYENVHFKSIDGIIDKTPCPVRNTKVLIKQGFSINNTVQKIDNITIYPQDFFCPLNHDSGELNITENTYSIHHYGYSWADTYSLKLLARKRLIYKLFPRFMAQVIFNLFNKTCRLLGR